MKVVTLRRPVVMVSILALTGTMAGRWALSGSGPTEDSDAVAQILAPSPGVKVRRGQVVPVTITVQSSSANPWTLALTPSGGDRVEIASGAGTIRHAIVAHIETEDATAGQAYRLDLIVHREPTAVVASSHFTVVDSEFALIPLQQGDLSQRGYYVYGVDGSGNKILYSSGSGDPAPMTILHRNTGVRETFKINLAGTQGVKLSGDGNRLFFKGTFSPSALGLGFLELSSMSAALVDPLAQLFFSVDSTGRRVTYERVVPDTDPERYHYVLFDTETTTLLNVTDELSSISRSDDCANDSGGTPVISADGLTIAFLTSDALGIAPVDPSIGCRVFVYDVASSALRQVAALPASWIHASLPSISADGHWLSFPARDRSAIFPVSILVDVQTGEVSAPAVDVGSFVVFDSAITRDGRGLVISTTADLDSRVGNADHNLELFYYDRQTGKFSQMSETVGGIGETANGCSSYLPRVSDDGGVAEFQFQLYSGEGCQLDGPQRDEVTGLSYAYFVRAVRKRPGNRGAILDPVPNQHVVAGRKLSIEFAASDPDGDPISFFVQTKDQLGIPPNATIIDHYDGHATYEWTTVPDDAGQSVLRVAAFDEGGGEMFQDVTISVLPSESTCLQGCSGEATEITVADLIVMVNIATESVPIEECRSGDVDGNGSISIDEIVLGVQSLLTGCGKK